MTITVAITGASGVQYGVRLLEVLNQLGVDTQLVVTKNGQELIGIETRYQLELRHVVSQPHVRRNGPRRAYCKRFPH